MMAGMREIVAKLQDLLAAGTPFVHVTMVQALGSTPQDTGSAMLVTAGGLYFGTVGGGRVEARAISDAQAMLREGRQTMFVEWNLQNDIKMTCGGAVKLFFQAHASKPWEIVVFGAGHVSQALVRTLINLDCKLTCIDLRKEWLDKLPDSPRLTKKHVENLAAQVPSLDDGAFVLMMTQGHSFDQPVLIELLRAGRFGYVGVIGSKAKRAALRRGVLEAGIAPELFETVHCPMGLDLGTNHPYEIAISIAAELIQVRDAQIRTK
jgi:xanthine dehydrogenase accessory factor